MALTANCGCDCNGAGACTLPSVKVKFSGFIDGPNNCSEINLGHLLIGTGAMPGTDGYYWLTYYGGREWRQATGGASGLSVRAYLPIGDIASITVYPLGALDSYSMYVVFEESAPGLRDWSLVAAVNPFANCGDLSGVAVDDWVEAPGDGCCPGFCAPWVNDPLYNGWTGVFVAGVTGTGSTYANGDWNIAVYHPAGVDYPEFYFDGYGCEIKVFNQQHRDGRTNNNLFLRWFSPQYAANNDGVCGSLTIADGSTGGFITWLMYSVDYPNWTLFSDTPGVMDAASATITLTPAI